MIQVWQIGENNIFTGKSYFVEEASENEITVPLTIGYIKPLWTSEEWVEGATEQEIQEWKDGQVMIVEPTTEERLEATEAAILALMEVLS